MSIKIMTEVYQSGLDKALKAIALAYADHADDNGNNIFPSVPYIAWKTGYTDRTVQRITKKLVGAGILVPDGDGPKGTNKYHMITGKLPVREPFYPDELQRGDKISGVTSTTEMSPMSPDPSYKSTISKDIVPADAKKESRARPETDHQKMVRVLCKVMNINLNLNFARYSPLAKAIRDAGYTPEEIENYYAPNGWWYTTYWVGKKFGEPPSERQIRDTIEEARTSVTALPTVLEVW